MTVRPFAVGDTRALADLYRESVRVLGAQRYAKLEAEARQHRIARLTTTASELAKPFFEKNGFKPTEIEHTQFGGADFARYKMEKRL